MWLHTEGAIEEIDRKELEKAKSNLETILLKQQKLIRIADREENGWEVVRHYISGHLASGSDDQKAINRARKEALASINKRKTKRREQFRSTKGSSIKYVRTNYGVFWPPPPPPPPSVRFLNREKVDFIENVRFWLDLLPPPVSVRTLWMVPKGKRYQREESNRPHWGYKNDTSYERKYKKIEHLL